MSGPEVQLLIDCLPVYTRIAQHIPDRNFGNGINLFVGQRSIEDYNSLKVRHYVSFITQIVFFL